MSTATIVIVLDLDEAADRPSGTATASDGATRSFHGWIGLASAIEGLVHPRSGAVPPAREQGDQP